MNLETTENIRQNQFALLRQRRFAPFFWVQFFGAGNDNIFKFAFTVLATYHAAQWGNVPPASVGALIGGIFILPFVLFSATSGQLADKYDKAMLIRLVKNLEIVFMLIIAYGFAMQAAWALYTGVFLMGLHSTLFGPVKFAYLPQHLNDAELTGGNGMVEMGTFVSILLGTILGGLLVNMSGGNGPLWVAGVSICIAIVGRIAAQFVPPSPAHEPNLKINWNPFTETWRNLKFAKQDRTVFLCLLGISWLWFFGAIFLANFAGFAKTVLGGNEAVVTLLLAVFSIGIGAGSVLCESLSGHKVEIGLVPFGSIGMTLFGVDLYFASRHMQPAELIGLAQFLSSGVNWRVLADLFLLALFAGFYSVPLYALMQNKCAPSHRARVIAANNILNAIFMVVSSVMTMLLLGMGLSLPELFLITAVLNALVAIYIYSLIPEFLLRFLAWILIHTVHRIKKTGLQNIPQEGAAVLVCNHVSYVDALVISACAPRPLRFVMDYRIFKTPVLGSLFRAVKAIPIAPAHEDNALLEQAYCEIASALKEGELVCIFPEGKLTSSGEINPFKSGISRILKDSPVPVIPMALKGLWGSMWTRDKSANPFARGFKRGPFSQLELAVGQAVPAAQASPEFLQERVSALRGTNQ